MNKISEVSLSAGLTINLGNFESIRCDVTVTAKYGPGEYSDEKFESLKEDVKAKLSSWAERVRN